MPYNFNIFNMLCTHCNFYISIINIHTKRNSHVLQSGLTISAYISLSFVVSFSFRRSLFRTFFVFVALVLLNFSPMPTDLYAMDFWFSIQHACIIYILYINKFSQKKNKHRKRCLFIYLFWFLLFSRTTRTLSCYIQKWGSKLICEVPSFILFGYSVNACKDERYLTKRWQLMRSMKSVATTMCTFPSSSKCYEVCFQAIFEAFFKWTLLMDSYHISLE